VVSVQYIIWSLLKTKNQNNCRVFVVLFICLFGKRIEPYGAATAPGRRMLLLSLFLSVFEAKVQMNECKNNYY